MMQDKSPGVERLIHQLRYDQNVFVRRQAASALASCIDIRAVLALIEALRAKSSMRAGTTTQAIPVELFLVGAGDIRTTAASSLIQLAPELKDKRAIDPLLMAVQDEDTYVRRVAFVALCELSAQLQDGTAVEALVRVQPKIDEDMAGHPIMERAGESRTAAHELLILLKELKEGGQLEPLLFGL